MIAGPRRIAGRDIASRNSLADTCARAGDDVGAAAETGPSTLEDRCAEHEECRRGAPQTHFRIFGRRNLPAPGMIELASAPSQSSIKAL